MLIKNIGRDRATILQQIDISAETPRSIENLKGRIDFKKGLRVNYFFGYLFVIGAIMMLNSLIFPPYEAGLMIFKGVFGTGFFLLLSFIFFGGAISRFHQRIRAFKNGQITTGIVVGHERKFVAWKSWRDYIVRVEFEALEGKKVYHYMQSSKEDLFTDHPIGSKVTAMAETDRREVFFPDEVGIEII